MHGRLGNPVSARRGHQKCPARYYGDWQQLTESGRLSQNRATNIHIMKWWTLDPRYRQRWLEREHEAFGVPFPHIGELLCRLQDASFLPNSIQDPHPPIRVGASVEQVVLKIVSPHADMWNNLGSPSVFRHKIARQAEHCRQIGHDPDTIEKYVLVRDMFLLRAQRNRSKSILPRT